MKLLAIETAAEACSAALLLDGEVTLRYQVEPRKHSELIMPMLDDLLQESGLKPTQLDAIAFGYGPGSFTGVRIAAGVAQGVAMGTDLPVVRVSTLAALAQGHFRQSGCRRVLPAFDARMQEVYWGCYELQESGLMQAQFPDEITSADTVTLPQGGNWHGVGGGWESYGETLSATVASGLESVTPDLFCSAHDIALLGAAGFERGAVVSADQALPQYLRDDVAKRPANPIRFG
ncbi:MAG: tRNA (adenosine(37)-N6)-threonylcarbamoyltransferase complex dimerization subunit type 1 TsaB [Gammaproteobacteria bacterium]|nr:tRNA (adenosine(37)-N6)-threonylcarbamoyltransferase complex dimerization subunit type 1 TsaB [Gammaproteobacteria bacterium]